MITSKLVKQSALKLWPKYLSSLVTEEQLFPLYIPFKAFSFKEGYLQVREMTRELLSKSKNEIGKGYFVELQETKSREFGTQTLPSRVCFETESDYLSFTDHIQDALSFKQMVALIKEKGDPFLKLLPLLSSKPILFLDYAEKWELLLDVAKWFFENKFSGLYIREIPLAIPTKFIESNTSVLMRMLEAILPEDHFNLKETQFEKRVGLRFDESIFRVRCKSPLLGGEWPCDALDDFAVPASRFFLFRNVKKIFIVENKMNFLTFPLIENSAVIWGSGFLCSSLPKGRGIEERELYYWGDLDAQGFQILSALRSLFPKVKSFLMDLATYEKYEHYSGTGVATNVRELSELTAEEHAVFDMLRNKNLRLEQERIPLSEVEQFLMNIICYENR